MGAMDIVYVDELFALNLLLDYLLLLSGARLRGAALRRGRFALAAALGGAYAAAAVLPGCGWLAALPVKLAASFLLALAAYGGDPGLLQGWACFLALSAAFGGAVYGAALLAGQERGGGVVVPVSLRVLVLSFGVCYAAVRLVFGRFLKKRERCVAPVTAEWGARRTAFSALRDTGNGLYDPVSGLPVLVADASALLPLFPPEAGALLRETDPAALLRRLSAVPGLAGRLRLVPYTAVGTGRGLLVCLRPDRLTVEGKREEMLLALSPTPLGVDGEYSAVI